MGSGLKAYVESNYQGKQDFYAAFIERCLDFISKRGYASLITMEAFMHQYSFRGLRPNLLEKANFIDALHIRNRATGSGEYRGLNIAFTMTSLDENTTLRTSRFVRITNDKDKELALKKVITGIRSEQSHVKSYIVDQSTFSEIDQTPFVYHLGDDILSLFKSEEAFSDISEIKTWLDTQGNDDKFIRKFWEVNPRTDRDWVKLVTNGDGDSYYESIVNRVLWHNDGEKVKEALSGSPRNEDWYFTEGLNYRSFSDQFCARYMPEDTIFGKHTLGVFPDDSRSIYWLIAYLNSTLIRHTANSLSPGLNFGKSDGGTLPIIDLSEKHKYKLEKICETQIQLRKESAAYSETSPRFNSKDLLATVQKDGITGVVKSEEILHANIRIGEGKVDSIIWDIIDATDKTINEAHSQFGENYYQLPILESHTESLLHETINIDSHHQIENPKPSQISISDDNIGDIFDASGELEISPISVAILRYQKDVYTKEERENVCGRLLSYYIGSIFGRWNNLGQITLSKDGILVFDDQFDDNVTDRIRECIEATFDDVYEKEAEIEDLLNKDMTDWLRENFFRYHHCKEYRRRGQRIPIYWHLESDDGAFSCFLYYHGLDADTLPKLRGRYVDAKIETLENRLESIQSQLDGASDDRRPELNSKLEEIQEQLDDVRDFGERLDELIDEGFEPDFEAGIWENIQRVDEYDLLQTELDKL